MGKMRSIFITLFLIIFFIFSCDLYQDDSTDDNMVCCESYGYGAQMVKCCETYEWTLPEECTVPEGFVGGGKEIVSDEFCE